MNSKRVRACQGVQTGTTWCKLDHPEPTTRHSRIGGGSCAFVRMPCLVNHRAPMFRAHLIQMSPAFAKRRLRRGKPAFAKRRLRRGKHSAVPQGRQDAYRVSTISPAFKVLRAQNLKRIEQDVYDIYRISRLDRELRL